MNPDLIALVLVFCMAPAATLFALLYGFTSPWWRTLVGRALLTMTTGLALLIDFSLYYHFVGEVNDVVRIVVYAIILVGVWLQLAALLVEKYRARKAGR